MPETKTKAVSGKLAEQQETSSHVSIKPLYTPADLEGWDHDCQLGYPGQFPYTRGVQASMYRGRLWTMRQYAGMGDAEESNRRYKYLLSHGMIDMIVHRRQMKETLARLVRLLTKRPPSTRANGNGAGNGHARAPIAQGS